MKIKLALLITALFALALPCAAQSLNYDDIRAHKLPAANSPEEARICAAEVSYTYVLLSRTDGIEQETLDKFGNVMDYWLARTAAINGKTADELMKDQAFIKEIGGLALIDTDTHIFYSSECLKRMG